MDSAASTLYDSSTTFEWCYQSDDAPVLIPHLSGWIRFSDVRIHIIEEAYIAKQGYVTFDDYFIDFALMVKVYNNATGRQVPVKRQMCARSTMALRIERFMYDFAISKQSFRDSRGWISPFIRAVEQQCGLKEKKLTSLSETSLSMMVEKAASGILEGGIQISRKCEAEWMSKRLMQKKDSGIEEIWKCCAYLYSMESFLYKEINKTLRTIGNEECEQTWRTKLHIYGPFCLFLLSNSSNVTPYGKTESIYRAATLTPAEIDFLKSDCSRKPTPERSFQAFTSCTRNRTLAELCDGNTLIIMKVIHAFTLDLAPFSYCPQEEEVLIVPGACFTVERVDLDKVKNTHLIFLNVIHRLSNDGPPSDPTQGTGTPLKDLLLNLKSREQMIGYNSKNKDVIDIIFLCRICSLILREPVQLACGHRQCKACVESKTEEDTIICPECQEETSKKDVLPDRGFKNEMKKLSIECLLCDWKGALKDYEDHLANEHINPPCLYCEQQFASVNQLNLHILNDCNGITIPCALKKYGCSTLIRRVEINQHYLTKEHQLAIIAFIRRDVPKFVTDPVEGASAMDVDNLPHTTTTMSGNVNTQLKEVDDTVDVLIGGVQALQEDAQRLTHESLQLNNMLDAVAKDFAKLKLSIQEQNVYLDGLKPNQEILSQDVASIKQKLEDLQFVSYDGTFIWKITNFFEKMADAQSERQPSIYSPPFYSSPTGYKMRARLYLNGDGNARGTHVSLFFVLMRSDYDPILKYPFNHKVTFCLYDQSGQQKHHIDSFRPDTKSNSFQRPRSEMNIASGIPKFCPRPLIQQEGNSFVRDDTMFIKIFVDFGDLNKPLLTYALSLNPGLAINVQQGLIKQEMEKRTQETST